MAGVSPCQPSRVTRPRARARTGAGANSEFVCQRAFARALGAARSGKPDDAKAEIAKLAELRDKLRAAKDAY